MLQGKVVVGGLQQLCGLLLIFLSSFSSMTTCFLTHSQVCLDISPLQGLTKLQTLHLSSGKYTAAQLPLHLTEACFIDCSISVEDDSACVTPLRKLQTVCCTMKGHGQGLPAFIALELLNCQHSIILADNREAELRTCNWLGTGLFKIRCQVIY